MINLTNLTSDEQRILKAALEIDEKGEQVAVGACGQAVSSTCTGQAYTSCGCGGGAC